MIRGMYTKTAPLHRRGPRLCQRVKHREWVEKRVKFGSVTAGLELSNLHPTSIFLTCGSTRTHKIQLQTVLSGESHPRLQCRACWYLKLENVSLLTEAQLLFSFNQPHNPCHSSYQGGVSIGTRCFQKEKVAVLYHTVGIRYAL